MTFAALIVKNLFRQRMRTALTVVGIAVGIATVVALGVITSGLRAASTEFVKSRRRRLHGRPEGRLRSHLQRGSRAGLEGDRGPIPDVERATGVLFEVAHVGSNPFFFYFGYEPEALRGARRASELGRLIVPGHPREAMLGTKAASDAGVSVGESIVLDGTAFRVVGLLHHRRALAGRGSDRSTGDCPALSSKKRVVTAVHVVAADGADPHAVAESIERDLPQLVAIESAADYGKVDQGFEILDAINLAISLLAVGIGAIGVMNTMIMSVFERTREIGVLRAVGWRGSRIVRMVLFESLALCVVAAVFGVLLGLLASRAILLVPAVSSFLEPSYATPVFVRALAVGVVVALAGALYPRLPGRAALADGGSPHE